MHIAINASLLNMQTGYRNAGVSRYSEHLLRNLGRARGAEPATMQISAFLQGNSAPDLQDEFPGVALHPVDLPLDRPLVRIGWEQGVLPRQLHTMQPDLVHGLVNVLPLVSPIPSVVTVHDLSFLRVPQTVPQTRRIYLSRLCAASVRKAQQVLAVSRQTADDLMHFFETPAHKITVVYNGVDERFRANTRTDAPYAHGTADPQAERPEMPERFLLYVGTLEPRKNLVRLIRAFGRWKARGGPDADGCKLVLLGGRGWYFQQIFDCVSELQLENDVIFPGYVPDDALPGWYRAADAFVYPSLLEGFGIPVLEAMASGTPILCSDIPSLAEVVGDGAVRVSPYDEESLMAGMALLMGQPALRRELCERGLARAAHFSWQRAARETLEIYRQVLR